MRPNRHSPVPPTCHRARAGGQLKAIRLGAIPEAARRRFDDLCRRTRAPRLNRASQTLLRERRSADETPGRSAVRRQRYSLFKLLFTILIYRRRRKK